MTKSINAEATLLRKRTVGTTSQVVADVLVRNIVDTKDFMEVRCEFYSKIFNKYLIKLQHGQGRNWIGSEGSLA